MTLAVKPSIQGVVRTPRHLYYFNGEGPWPGVIVPAAGSPT